MTSVAGPLGRPVNARRAYIRDLVVVMRSARAAVRREQPALAVHMLTTAAFEVGVARCRFGPSAAMEGLQRSVARMERVIAAAIVAGA